jgi:predicted metal-dependent hydrolase
MSAYHPLYISGIDQFNQFNYFASHEIWEELWITEAGPSRQFYKGLIQAAVAMYHLSNGNAHGACKLLAGARRYLGKYRPRYLGLNIDRFLGEVSRCINETLSQKVVRGKAEIDRALIPSIHLDPPPRSVS